MFSLFIIKVCRHLEIFQPPLIFATCDNIRLQSNLFLLYMFIIIFQRHFHCIPCLNVPYLINMCSQIEWNYLHRDLTVISERWDVENHRKQCSLALKPIILMPPDTQTYVYTDLSIFPCCKMCQLYDVWKLNTKHYLIDFQILYRVNIYYKVNRRHWIREIPNKISWSYEYLNETEIWVH